MWNVPSRNAGFTGRDALLVAVRERLQADERAVVQALQGMGGVGKTQLATEYAHRFAGTYDLVWWISSGQTGLIGDQFAAGAHQRARAYGGGLRLVLPAGGAVARVLSFTGLDGFIPGFASLEHALAPAPGAAIPPSPPAPPPGRRSPARRPGRAAERR